MHHREYLGNIAEIILQEENACPKVAFQYAPGHGNPINKKKEG